MYFDGIFIKSHDIASKVEATLKLKFVEDLFFLLLKKNSSNNNKNRRNSEKGIKGLGTKDEKGYVSNFNSHLKTIDIELEWAWGTLE